MVSQYDTKDMFAMYVNKVQEYFHFDWGVFYSIPYSPLCVLTLFIVRLTSRDSFTVAAATAQKHVR